MADEKPTLHIDDDWKRQAQEEKRKLAEAEQKRKEEEERRRAAAEAAPPPPGIGVPPDVAAARAAGPSMPGQRAPGDRGIPPASFLMLAQSILTQALFYLGDLAPRGAEPQINLDLAKNQIDLLGVLEEKTKGNLTDEERTFLDNTLYEVRMRYVAVASQYATV